jgi:hypothetical protein
VVPGAAILTASVPRIVLEAALVDHTAISVSALDPSDPRHVDAQVAGVAALLIAKAHKLQDRLESDDGARAHDKDTADVYRLMRGSSAADVADTLSRLSDHEVAGQSVKLGIAYLLAQFSRRRATGVRMAMRSFRLAIPEAQIATLCVAYSRQLADALETRDARRR